MATRVPSPDYTSRDFASIKQDMVRAIPHYTQEWTDHNEADFGIVMVNLFAGMLDVLHFYVDRASGEMYLPTAVKRESVVKILKLINFELRSIVPASADVTFSMLSTLASPVLIPRGTKVQTVASEDQTPVVYETATDVTIPALSLTATVSVIEGEAGTEDLDNANGQPFQPFVVQAVTIVEGSFELEIDEGAGFVVWTKVDTFVDSTPTDTHYRIERDANEVVTVFVGDNLQGKIPTATSRVRANFRVIQGDRGGAGVFGNVGAGVIRIVQSTIFSNGVRVTLEVTNPLQASGGEDRQSMEEAKRLGPASLRALNRAVTPEDYKTLSEQFGGVAKAKVVQGTSDDPCCACALELYVAPTGGGNLSGASKLALLEFLDERKMVGTCLTIEDPDYVDVDMTGSVFVYSNFDLPTVQDVIAAAINSFFEIDGDFADFGTDLFLGNLFAALEDVDGVQHIDLGQVTRRPDPVLEIWTGDATIGDVVTGAAAADEEWIITFLSPTTFSVIGEESGIQTDGVVNVPYESDEGEVAFTISAGVTPMALGNRATFRTSPLLGNVPIRPTEIMKKGAVDLTYVVVPTRSAGQTC